jgi:cytochrome c553
MRAMHFIAGAVVVALAVTGLRLADAQSPARKGDPKHGAEIAKQGTTAGAPACEACHGVNGNPDGSGTFPRLFGLPAYYLAKQISDYRSNARQNAIMAGVAQALSEDDIADVAAYYATAKEPFPSFAAADPALMTRGRELAIVGDAEKGVPACNNCHGPGGIGLPPAIPPLAGQFAPYIVAELQFWQKGERRNDGGAQMSELARRLDARDVAAVAAYYQRQVKVDTVGGAPAPK